MILPPISTLIAIDPSNMARPLYPSSVSLSSTSLQKSVQDLLLPHKLTVAKIENLSNHLHRIYRISLSNGSRLILKLPPPASTSLLRHEKANLKTEAVVLSHLAKTGLPIARILKYDKKGPRLGSPFLLTTHLPGIRYADALPYLSRSERLGIEAQIRNLRATMSQHVSRTFGPAALVAANRGFSTWREAFASMMESVLMDGEDMMINLPYITIRDLLSACAGSFDEVKEARLVVLSLEQPENVLIERRTNSVTGLLDFSQAIWGDPAFANGGVEVGAGRRAMLYAVYHAVVAIVTNHYRPQREGEGQLELDARKRLTTVLGKLSGEK
jgi:hypothetical protein